MSAALDPAGDGAAVDEMGADVGGAEPGGVGEVPGNPGVSDGLKVHPAPAPGAHAARVAAATPAAPIAPRRRKLRRFTVASSSFVIGEWSNERANPRQ